MAIAQRRAAAAIGLVAVAAAGNLLLILASNQAELHAGVQPAHVGGASDLDLLLRAGADFLHAQPARPLYGSTVPMSYAPPFAVLFSPLSLLPRRVAIGLAACLAVLFIALAVRAWARLRTGGSMLWLPVLLSVPTLQVLKLAQLQTGLGLIALTAALLAQRRDRWVLAGMALALGSLRISNALPVTAMLLVGAWGRPRAALRAAMGAGLVLGPLCAVAFMWDPSWPSDYLATLSHERLYGPIGLVQILFGNAGVMAVTLLDCAFCAALVRRSAGRPLDPDRAAVGMASTVVTAMLAGWYCAVFAFPALVRTAGRAGREPVVWVVGILPWVAVLLTAPWLLSRDPLPALNVLATLGPLALAGMAFALLRRPAAEVV